jgi:hypothetical protein
MYKKKSKHPQHMTDEEAVKHLFHRYVVKHVTKEVAPTVKKQSTTKKKV